MPLSNVRGVSANPHIYVFEGTLVVFKYWVDSEVGQTQLTVNQLSLSSKVRVLLCPPKMVP